MNNLQQSLVEAEWLRRESEHLRHEDDPLLFNEEFEDQPWLLEAEERQREYRDEADTLAGLLRF